MTQFDLPMVICGCIIGAWLGNALFIVSAAAWQGLRGLLWTFRAFLAARERARQARLRAIADAIHRQWFVDEMRADPNAFGGNHKPWEIQEGE